MAQGAGRSRWRKGHVGCEPPAVVHLPLLDIHWQLSKGLGVIADLADALEPIAVNKRALPFTPRLAP